MIRNCNLCGLQYEVADRNCGTYKANFCSESCRDLFVAKFNKKEINIDIDTPRYCVRISVEDGETGEALIEEGFNTPKIEYIINSLKSVIEKLENFV